jgi:hypothetical protein
MAWKEKKAKFPRMDKNPHQMKKGMEKKKVRARLMYTVNLSTLCIREFKKCPQPSSSGGTAEGRGQNNIMYVYLSTLFIR